MSTHRFAIVVATALAVSLSSVPLPAIAAAVSASGHEAMACCRKVARTDCHAPRSATMQCCDRPAPDRDGSLPASTIRLERPTMLLASALHAPASALQAAAPLALPWARAPGFAPDVSPHLLHRVFRI